MKTGYILIEFILYLATFTFIALIFFGLVSQVQFKVLRSSEGQEKELKQALALDILRRDLLGASSNSADWDEGVFKKFILTKKNSLKSECVCWFIGKHGLMRAEGDYNFEKHTWIKKTSCLVCKKINKINFIAQKKRFTDFLNGVWVVYSDSESCKESKIFMRLRNRIL